MNETQSKPAAGAPARPSPQRPRSTGRMHENVPVWSDPCCCCEAEPYWREVAEELGIDLDGDRGSCS